MPIPLLMQDWFDNREDPLGLVPEAIASTKPPTSPEDKLRYRRMLEQAVLSPPQRPQPGMGQAVAAGLSGGLAGLLNLRRPGAVDPRMIAQTQERILQGDYPEQVDEYKQRLRGLSGLAELEQKDALEGPYKEAQAGLAAAKAGYEKSRAETELEKARLAANAKTGSASITADASKHRTDTEAKTARDKLYIKASLVDPAYAKERGVDAKVTPDHEFRMDDYQTWKSLKIASDSGALRRQANEDLKGYRSKKLAQDYDIAKRRIAVARAQLAQQAQGKDSMEPEEDYVKALERAETTFLRELGQLDRAYKIGMDAYGQAMTPEKLPDEAKRLYFERRAGLEKKLMDSKRKSANLYSGLRKDAEPIDFSEHEENLKYFEQQAKGPAAPAATPTAKPAASTGPTRPAAAKPTASTGSGVKGTISVSSPEFKQIVDTKFGGNLQTAIADAIARGYTVGK